MKTLRYMKEKHLKLSEIIQLKVETYFLLSLNQYQNKQQYQQNNNFKIIGLISFSLNEIFFRINVLIRLV